MIPNRLHGVDDFHHVSQTLRWGQPQQRPNVRDIYATLILERLLLGHSPRIGEKSWLAGCVRLTPDHGINHWDRVTPPITSSVPQERPRVLRRFPRKHRNPRWSLTGSWWDCSTVRRWTRDASDAAVSVGLDTGIVLVGMSVAVDVRSNRVIMLAR